MNERAREEQLFGTLRYVVSEIRAISRRRQRQVWVANGDVGAVGAITTTQVAAATLTLIAAPPIGAAEIIVSWNGSVLVSSGGIKDRFRLQVQIRQTGGSTVLSPERSVSAGNGDGYVPFGWTWATPFSLAETKEPLTISLLIRDGGIGLTETLEFSLMAMAVIPPRQS